MHAQSLPQETSPLLVAIAMGYGHLRPAHALSEVLGTPVLDADKPPLADADEQRSWERTRDSYEKTSRVSQWGPLAAPVRWVLDGITAIPPFYPRRDQSPSTFGLSFLTRTIRSGLGHTLVEQLKSSGRPLLTTFYAPAIIADLAGLEHIFCVGTDSDLNRAWASPDTRNTRIHYFAPSSQVVRRMRGFGVPAERLELTGFPLPPALLGGPELPVLKRNLAARLVRLDPTGAFLRSQRAALEAELGVLPSEPQGEPPLVTFAVGGAGAQSELARLFLPSLREPIRAGKLRLALIAGIRPEVARRFEGYLAEAGLTEQLGHGIELLLEPTMEAYLASFNALMARTDVLWSKPSEISFFAALGLPLVLSAPVGAQEVANRAWVLEQGAGIDQRAVSAAAEWLLDLVEDGLLAASAWTAYQRLPKRGVYRIAEAVRAACAGLVRRDVGAVV